MQGAKDQTFLLEFEEVVKDFRTPFGGPVVRALDSASWKVRPGQIAGLVGPNGSGKTTAFRVAVGLLKPDRGGVRVLGTEPGSKIARSETGYMPEQPGLPGTLNPSEILDFMGRVFGGNSKERAARSRELERLLSLSDYMKRRMSRLSKGMLKRVGLATALYNRPRLLLLDEPLEGLDPLGSAEIKDHIARLADEGAGVLISSHILSDVEALCSWIIVINEGKVLIQGERDAILAVRDCIEVRFRAPQGSDVLDEVRRIIESRGGEVDFAGHPREGLETLFRKIVGREASSPPGARP